MAKLYHVTKPENVDSILRNGLLRCHGSYRSAFISLSERPDSWIQKGLVLLEVDVDGIGCKETTWLPQSDEICVWGDIPPERIKVIYMDSAKRLAECAKRFVDILCESCTYRDEEDPSCVKCRNLNYCNLKEIRFLIEDILGGNHDETGGEQKDS